MGGDCKVGLTTDAKRWKKWAPFNQASMCEFQREFKFGTEDKKWLYKYRSRFVGVENREFNQVHVFSSEH